MNVEKELLQQVKQKKLTYGHIVRKTKCLEKDSVELSWVELSRIGRYDHGFSLL